MGKARTKDAPIGVSLPRPSARRILVERFVLIVLFGLVVRTWYLQGLFLPLQVVGGSMAESLRGRHRVLTCDDCGHRFACGTHTKPVRRHAVCPNCDFPKNDLAGCPDAAGDRLLLDRSVFSVRPLRRWEPVALRNPERPREIVVKRAVGLPGETVEIREGNIHVNGQIARKTLARQRAVAVLVHDASCVPRRHPELPPRWRPQREKVGRFEVQWFVYEHTMRMPADPGRAIATPVTNRLGYNLSRFERAEYLCHVPDLLLSFRWMPTPKQGRLLLRATDGSEQFLIAIDPARSEVTIDQENRPPSPRARGGLPPLAKGSLVEVSLFDQQLLLAIDGQVAVTRPFDRKPKTALAALRPFAIGREQPNGKLPGQEASGGKLSERRLSELGVREVRLFRDIHYTQPVGAPGRPVLEGPVALGPDEYFVLGDNSPVSADCRTWPGGPAVPGRLIVGRPIFVHLPLRGAKLGGLDFQVPNPPEIRYIP